VAVDQLDLLVGDVATEAPRPEGIASASAEADHLADRRPDLLHEEVLVREQVGDVDLESAPVDQMGGVDDQTFGPTTAEALREPEDPQASLTGAAGTVVVVPRR
jgi:hypothetical protein